MMMMMMMIRERKNKFIGEIHQKAELFMWSVFFRTAMKDTAVISSLHHDFL